MMKYSELWRESYEWTNRYREQVKGQYAASIETYDAIQNQALKMADEMAWGIILQFKL